MKGSYTTHGEQVIDKESDIRKVKSDTHVLNSGPTYPQSMRGVL